MFKNGVSLNDDVSLRKFSYFILGGTDNEN